MDGKRKVGNVEQEDGRTGARPNGALRGLKLGMEEREW